MVHLGERGIVITPSDREGSDSLIWPYAALAVEEPLSAHSIDALITYSYQPGAALFVPDKSFARALKDHAPHLTLRAHRVRAARPWLWASGLMALAVIAVVLSEISPAKMIAELLPDRARTTLGDQVLKSMTRDYARCVAPDGIAALDQLTAKLSAATSLLPGAGRSFTVVVVDWDLVNAFATPGERIVITRGLIENAKSPDEVAGVLAHEMGHGIELHPEAGLVRGIGLAAAAELVFGGAGSGLANVGLMLTQLSYSRRAEREADQHGLSILKEARVSPKGLLDFFSRVDELEQDAGGRAPDILLSHPQTEERRQVVAAVPPYPSEPALEDRSWRDLKSICGLKEGDETAPNTAPLKSLSPLPGETEI